MHPPLNGDPLMARKHMIDVVDLGLHWRMTNHTSDYIGQGDSFLMVSSKLGTIFSINDSCGDTKR